MKATSRLVGTTARLTKATWGLGGATLLLVVMAAIPVYQGLRHEDVGLRLRRECEAIIREAVEAADQAGRGGIAQTLKRDGVLNCLLEGAKDRR